MKPSEKPGVPFAHVNYRDGTLTPDSILAERVVLHDDVFWFYVDCSEYATDRADWVLTAFVPLSAVNVIRASNGIERGASPVVRP